MGVPTNKLHACGYDSIGCEPCTRPVLPNQAEREGRWWWEDATAKECGLHSGNVKKEDGTTEERKAERDLWADGSVVEALSKAQAEAMAAGTRDQDTLLVLYAPWCPFCQVGRHARMLQWAAARRTGAAGRRAARAGRQAVRLRTSCTMPAPHLPPPPGPAGRLHLARAWRPPMRSWPSSWQEAAWPWPNTRWGTPGGAAVWGGEGGGCPGARRRRQRGMAQGSSEQSADSVFDGDAGEFIAPPLCRVCALL